jgi:hypothetical protein
MVRVKHIFCPKRLVRATSRSTDPARVWNIDQQNSKKLNQMSIGYTLIITLHLSPPFRSTRKFSPGGIHYSPVKKRQTNKEVVIAGVWHACWEKTSVHMARRWLIQVDPESSCHTTRPHVKWAVEKFDSKMRPRADTTHYYSCSHQWAAVVAGRDRRKLGKRLDI